MEYTTLGNTDIRVSKLCVGCMSFGKPGTLHDWTLDEAGTEACQWEREYLAEVEVQWLDELEAAGTQINYPDKAPFVEAMSSVYDEFVGDGDDMVSPELLEQVREIISQVE